MAAAVVVFRSRGANFTPHEKAVLLSLVDTHRDAIENRNLDAASLLAKNAAWTQITRQFRIECPANARDCKQLRKCYENLKKRLALGASPGGALVDQDASPDSNESDSRNGMVVMPTITSVTGGLSDDLHQFFVETVNAESEEDGSRMRVFPKVEQESDNEALRPECTLTILPRPDTPQRSVLQSLEASQNEAYPGGQGGIVSEDNSRMTSNISVPEAGMAPISPADREGHSSPGSRTSQKRRVGRVSNLDHTRRRVLVARARLLETKTRLLEEKHEKELKILDVKQKQEEVKLQMLKMELAKRKLR